MERRIGDVMVWIGGIDLVINVSGDTVTFLDLEPIAHIRVWQIDAQDLVYLGRHALFKPVWHQSSYLACADARNY